MFFNFRGDRWWQRSSCRPFWTLVRGSAGHRSCRTRVSRRYWVAWSADPLRCSWRRNIRWMQKEMLRGSSHHVGQDVSRNSEVADRRPTSLVGPSRPSSPAGRVRAAAIGVEYRFYLRTAPGRSYARRPRIQLQQAGSRSSSAGRPACPMFLGRGRRSSSEIGGPTQAWRRRFSRRSTANRLAERPRMVKHRAPPRSRALQELSISAVGRRPTRLPERDNRGGIKCIDGLRRSCASAQDRPSRPPGRVNFLQVTVETPWRCVQKAMFPLLSRSGRLVM